MIHASDARFNTDNGKLFKKLMDKLEKEIIENSNAGLDRACVDFPTETCESVRTKLREECEQNGYIVEITDYDKTEAGAPCDQRHWFDVLTVKW